jgi:hypothetical protein
MQVYALFERGRLDVLCLTEARDYIGALRGLAKQNGDTLLSINNGKRGSNQCAMLVRKGAHIGKVWSIRAGTGWRRAGGGWMAPMQPLCAIIDGEVYVAGHAPVSAWQATPRGRKFIGPLARRVAYRGFVKRLAKVAKRHKGHPVKLWCDWNATPDTTGRYSPNWLRQEIGGRFARPHTSTGHGEIDFCIVVGDQASDVSALDAKPGDHKMVMAVFLS